MNTLPYLRFLKQPIVAGLVVFGMLLFLTQTLTYQRYLLLKNARQAEVSNQADWVKERLQTIISYSQSTTQTLGFIVEKNGVPKDFDRIARTLLKNNRYIDAIQLVEGGVITRVYPTKGNESVLGYNILRDTITNKGAFTAIKKKEFFLAGPIKLKQGGAGFVGRWPIFKDNKFWGFTAVVIRMPTLLHAAGLDTPGEQRFLYQLAKVDADTREEEFFLPDHNTIEKGYSVPVEVPNGEWKLYVVSENKVGLSAVIAFALLGFVLAAIGGLFTWFFIGQPEKLNQLVNEKTTLLTHERNLSDSIINSMPGIFYMSDINGAMLRWNKNFEDVSGYSSAEISAMRVRQFVEESDKVTLIQKKQQAIEEGIAAAEVRFLTKNNTIIPYYFTSLYTSYNGQSRMLGIGINMTERKKAEEQIVNERNLSESIVNSMPGVFYLYDDTGKFIRWNKNFETVSGYSGEEVSRMHPLDFFVGEEKVLLEQKIRKVFEEGSAEVEAEFVAKNGERKPYYFNGWATTYQNKPCLIGVGVDITDRKKAEKALQVSEEKYRYLFNNNPALIIIWDPETLRVMEVNEKVYELYGYSQKEYLNMDVLQYRPTDDHEKIKEFAVRIAGEANAKYRGTWRHLKKTGEMMYMDITSHLIDYNNRKAVLSLANDVTKQVMAEEQLKKSYEDIQKLNSHLQIVREEERTNIAREIHDELGQQLTGLKMDASWLMKKLSAEDKAIHEKINDMLGLLDNTIKTVRRISSDLRPGILDDLGLIAALEWQSNEFEKRTGISCWFITSLADMEIDKSLATGIFRVYQEALTNIMRHAGATQVDTSLVESDNRLILTIHDNGKGFDIESIKNKNTLGLLGMKERANMLNGQLTIESERGTTIILDVPLTIPPHT